MQWPHFTSLDKTRTNDPDWSSSIVIKTFHDWPREEQKKVDQLQPGSLRTSREIVKLRTTVTQL